MTVRWLKPGDPFVPTVIVLALAAWLLRSFFEPIAWAFLLALATWPLHRRFSSLLPGWFGRDGRALLFTALVALFGLGPFVLVLVVFARQAASWARTLTSTDSLAAPPEWLQRTPLLGSWLIEVWNDELGASGGIRGLLHHADAQKVLGWLEVAGRIALRHVTVDVFAILALFFLFRGGEPLVERLERLVSRLGPHGDACLRLAADTVRATLIGLLLVMMTDGLLVGIACAIAGVPSPLTWAAATAVAACIPFLAYAVLAAATMAVLVHGSSLAATLLFAWGFVVIFAADKIVRPALLGSATHLGFFWVLVGTLGGVETFGLIGLILGPVLLTLAGAFWREWTESRSGTADARLEPVDSL